MWKSIQNAWNLNKHQKTHPERSVCKCDECGKAYRQKTNLIQHQKIHTKETPYNAKLVGKPSPGCHLTVITRKSTGMRKPMSAMYVASPSNGSQPLVNIKTLTRSKSLTDVRTVRNLSFASLLL